MNAISTSRTARFSFEVFPPATPEATPRFDGTVAAVAELDPAFVSVTYGAGGTGRERTFAAIDRAGRALPGRVAGHLTCVGQSRAEVDAAAATYRRSGVARIVALRGDAPNMAGPYAPHPDGYRNAADLVAGLSAKGWSDISVAAYPEVHPDSPTPQADLDNLAAKLDAGASRAITQFCFDWQPIVRLRDRLADRGNADRLVPGVLLINNFANVRRFASRCRAAVPGWLDDRFAGLEAADPAHLEAAVEVAGRQIETLAAEGFEAFHIYALNDPALTRAFGQAVIGAPLGEGATPAAVDFRHAHVAW